VCTSSPDKINREPRRGKNDRVTAFPSSSSAFSSFNVVFVVFFFFFFFDFSSSFLVCFLSLSLWLLCFIPDWPTDFQSNEWGREKKHTQVNVCFCSYSKRKRIDNDKYVND
jgi:hypothetical protein